MRIIELEHAVEDTSVYHIGSRTLSVVYEDLTRLDHEVLVSSDDSDLSMGGGVSRALKRVGGKSLEEHALKFVSSASTALRPGDVIVTTAGRLTARYVFHAVTIDYRRGSYPDTRVIESATVECMRLANALRVKSIAFPALGTGAGNFPFQPGADAMVRALARSLDAETTVERVTLALFARTGVTDADLTAFYEHAVGLASVWSQTGRLGALVHNLHGLSETRLSGTLGALEGDLHDAQATLATTPEAIEDIVLQSDGRDLIELGERAIGLSEQYVEEAGSNDPTRVVAALRTDLEGRRTKVNGQVLLMTKLHYDRARYDAGSAPAELDETLKQLAAKIQTSYAGINEVKQRLATCEQAVASLEKPGG